MYEVPVVVDGHQSEFVFIMIMDDGEAEEDELFTVLLTGVARGDENLIANVTIIDDDRKKQIHALREYDTENHAEKLK